MMMFRRLQDAKSRGSGLPGGVLIVMIWMIISTLSSLAAAIYTLSFERSRPLFQVFRILQSEINGHPQVYGMKAYHAAYVPSIMVVCACLLIVSGTPLGLYVLHTVIVDCKRQLRARHVLSTKPTSGSTTKYGQLIWPSVGYLLFSFLAVALLIGAVTSGFVPIGNMEHSLQSDMYLLFLRAKFREQNAMSSIEKLHDALDCCGVKAGHADWMKPPYEQSPPVSCTMSRRESGCLQRMYTSLNSHQILNSVIAFASLCILCFPVCLFLLFLSERMKVCLHQSKHSSDSCSTEEEEEEWYSPIMTPKHDVCEADGHQSSFLCGIRRDSLL